MRRSLLHSVASPFRPLVYLLMALALTVGLAACDSSGSNDGEEEEEEPQEVARTFEVTVESIEGTDYPYSEQNQVGVAYAIDGEVGKVITLERGNTYEFDLQSSVASGPNNAEHPFYVGDTPEGGGAADEYGDGVENGKESTGSVYFTPPSSAPDSLYYLCDFHPYMGGKMMIDEASEQSSPGDDDGY